MDAGLPAAGEIAQLYTTQPPIGKPTRQAGAIDHAAKEFEAMFMAQMLQPMFAGIETDDMFGGGQGEDMVRGLIVQEYGKAVADSGASGMTNAIRTELLRLQEVTDNQTSGGSL